MLSAVLKIQRNYRAQVFPKIFQKTLQIIKQLQSCDQNIICSVLGHKEVQSEPVRVVFKLDGQTMPPSIVYALKLVGSININKTSRVTLGGVLHTSKLVSFVPRKRENVFLPLRVMKDDMRFYDCVDLTGSQKAMLKQVLFKPKPPKSEAHKRAEKLRIVFGLEKDHDGEFQESLAASQAEDLQEFIKKLNSIERQQTVEKKIDEHFDVDERFNLDDLNDIIGKYEHQLPQQRFD